MCSVGDFKLLILLYYTKNAINNYQIRLVDTLAFEIYRS